MLNPHKALLFAKHYLQSKPESGPVASGYFEANSFPDFKLTEYYKQINSLASLDSIQVKIIEEIIWESTILPIYQIDFRPISSSQQKLLVLAGTHGNEQAGILAVVKFLEKYIDSGTVTLRIITPHNPVGVHNLSRYNAEGYDLNRDFKLRNTKENIAVYKSIIEFNPSLAVSLHEGPQQGAFFFANHLYSEAEALRLVTGLSEQEVKLSSKSYFGNTLSEPGYFPLKDRTQILLNLQKSILRIASFDVLCADLAIPSITYETSWFDKLEVRLQAQLSLLCLIALN